MHFESANLPRKKSNAYQNSKSVATSTYQSHKVHSHFKFKNKTSGKKLFISLNYQAKKRKICTMLRLLFRLLLHGMLFTQLMSLLTISPNDVKNDAYFFKRGKFFPFSTFPSLLTFSLSFIQRSVRDTLIHLIFHQHDH